MNPEKISEIRQRLERLYQISGSSPKEQAVDILGKLDGYVDVSLIKDKKLKKPDLGKNERLTGLYLNYPDSYLLLTNKALHWIVNAKVTRLIPYDSIILLELANEDNILVLRITEKSGEIHIIQLIHDDPDIRLKDTASNTAPVNLKQLVAFDSELQQYLPEIAQWVLDGNPDDSMLLQHDIEPRLVKEKSCMEWLYAALEEAKEAAQAFGSRRSFRVHPATKLLHNIENLVLTEMLPDEELDSMEKDLGVYFNNETNYFILSANSITVVWDEEKQTIKYDEMKSVKIKPASTSICIETIEAEIEIPVISYNGENQAINRIYQYLRLVTAPNSVESIESLDDFIRYIINQYERIPYCEILVPAYEELFALPPEFGDEEYTGQFFRLLALILTHTE